MQGCEPNSCGILADGHPIMTQPLYSVLVANYNRGPYLREAIQSILDQSYQSKELVIVDDGSTDDSWEIISEFSRSDKGIVVHRNSGNTGCGAAMRKCAELSSGELLCLVGSDDVLVPGALEIMAKAHLEFPSCSLINSTHYVCDEHLHILRMAYGAAAIPKGESYLSFGKGITNLVSFTRLHYARTAGIDASFKRAVDQDLFYKLEEVGSVHFIDQPLYKYRVNSSGISTLKNLSKSRYWFGLAKDNAYHRRLKAPSVKSIEKKELNAWWSLVYMSKAGEAFRSFRLGKGICWFLMSITKSTFDSYAVLKLQSLFLSTYPHRWYQQWRKKQAS